MNTEQTLPLAVDIVTAYLSQNHMPVGEIPGFISATHKAIRAEIDGTAGADTAETPARIVKTPSEIKKSITPDALISFEDGKSYKAMKRHLRAYGLTPQEYREKYGLPNDYPMVAPSYSAMRSKLAKGIGLGKVAPPTGVEQPLNQ
jgi:predicted transcriptional regulator